MLALNRLKEKSAFKIYAKSQNVDFTTTNKITASLEEYEKAVLSHKEDEFDEDDENYHALNVYDYIPKEYHKVYDDSKRFQGIIDAASPHPCFTSKTLITTAKGQVKIKDVKKGDLVLTHNNRFMPVLETTKTKTEEIVELYFSFGKLKNILKCTPNHPMLVSDGSREYWCNADCIRTDEVFLVSYDKQLIKIDKIKYKTKHTYVYNLKVANDNTYIANNMITHNCGNLLLNGSISKDVGLMKIKDEIVALIEGKVADKWGYVKND